MARATTPRRWARVCWLPPLPQRGRHRECPICSWTRLYARSRRRRSRCSPPTKARTSRGGRDSDPRRHPAPQIRRSRSRDELPASWHQPHLARLGAPAQRRDNCYRVKPQAPARVPLGNDHTTPSAPITLGPVAPAPSRLAPSVDVRPDGLRPPAPRWDALTQAAPVRDETEPTEPIAPTAPSPSDGAGTPRVASPLPAELSPRSVRTVASSNPDTPADDLADSQAQNAHVTGGQTPATPAAVDGPVATPLSRPPRWISRSVRTRRVERRAQQPRSDFVASNAVLTATISKP